MGAQQPPAPCRGHGRAAAARGLRAEDMGAQQPREGSVQRTWARSSAVGSVQRTWARSSRRLRAEDMGAQQPREGAAGSVQRTWARSSAVGSVQRTWARSSRARAPSSRACDAAAPTRKGARHLPPQ
eukprot:gene21691-41395_t